MSTNFRVTRCSPFWRATWLMVALLTLLLCGKYSSVTAQEAKPQYDELSIPSSFDVRGKTRAQLSEVNARIRELESDVRKILSGELPLSGSEVRFDAYFQRYVLPQWTFVEKIENTEKNDKNELLNFNFFYLERKKYIANNLMRCRELSSVHAHLVKITLEKLAEIAKSSPEATTDGGAKKLVPKNLHPAARYFAMLFIAELNERELISTGNASAPIPLADAVPVMREALQDPQQLDSVKVAAWMGVMRYLDWESRQGLANPSASLIAAEKPAIDKLAIELINAKVPPAGRSLEGHVWMQRRALEVLTLTGTLEKDVNLAPLVESMVGDVDAAISLRCSAAEALGQLDLPPTTKLVATETAKKLGELAVFVCQRELKRLDDEKLFYEDKKEWQRVSASGGRGALDGQGARMLGGMQGMPNDDRMNPNSKDPQAIRLNEEYRRTLTQRRIKSQMECIANGLAGIQGKSAGIVGMAKANGNPAVAAFATEITTAVVGLRDINDEINDLEVLVSQIRDRSTKLDKLLQSPPNANARPAAAAAPAADELPAAPNAKPAAAKNELPE